MIIQKAVYRDGGLEIYRGEAKDTDPGYSLIRVPGDTLGKADITHVERDAHGALEGVDQADLGTLVQE